MIEWKVVDLDSRLAISLRTLKAAEALYEKVRSAQLVRVDHAVYLFCQKTPS